MGRFEKLNRDINKVADMMLSNQDLCKLIYYPDNNPLSQPDINGKKKILDKRLLLFTPKLPLADEVGTYVSIRTPKLVPLSGGYYVSALLCFDIYCHKDIRSIYYFDNDGHLQKGDRAVLIMDLIEGIMPELNIGIGSDNLDAVGEISNANATFSGYQIAYDNVEFRMQGA